MDDNLDNTIGLFFYFLVGCFTVYGLYKNHKEINTRKKNLREAEITIVKSLAAISIAIFREVAKRKTNQRANKSANN